MKIPSLKRCIAVAGPTDTWKGNCFYIASRIVSAGLTPGGVAVYGHWLGPIAETSFFASKRGLMFCQHGWILMPDNSVIDPTRWAFENKKPYIFHGSAKDDNGKLLYDEGGNSVRMALMGGPPEYNSAEKQLTITSVVMRTVTWNFVEKILEIDTARQDHSVLSLSQLCWLANLPPSVLGEHMVGVYRALEKLGKVAYIPIDNYRMYERKQEIL